MAIGWGVGYAKPFFAYLKRLDLVIKQGRVREIGMRLGSPTEMPQLDFAALERATQEMKALGFVHAGDCVMVTSQTVRNVGADAPIASPSSGQEAPPETMKMDGFERVMLHERERCVGKIMVSIVAPLKGGPPRTTFFRSFVSYADAPDGGAVWDYGTSDLQYKSSAAAISKLWRRPRSLGVRLPEAPLSELWRVHLHRRAQVAEVAGLRWNRATLQESLDSSPRSVQNMRAVFAQLTPLKMAWLLWRYKREKDRPEWLGELRGKLPPLSP